jgi:hypothetical protein
VHGAKVEVPVRILCKCAPIGFGCHAKLGARASNSLVMTFSLGGFRPAPQNQDLDKPLASRKLCMVELSQETLTR